MNNIYSEIKIDEGELGNYFNPDGSNVVSINNLSLVNIFIGANNSGKSRFLRSLSRDNNPNCNFKNPDTKLFLAKTNKLSSELVAIKNGDNGEGVVSFSVDGFGQFNESDFNEINENFISGQNRYDRFIHLLNALKSDNKHQINSSRGHYNIDSFFHEVKNFLRNNITDVDFVTNFSFKNYKHDNIYIPILRSLNSFQKELGFDPRDKNDIKNFYLERVVENYLIDQEKTKIFNGQDLYFVVRDLLLGDQEERDKISNYENFLSEEIFDGQEVSLIPNPKNDVLTVKIGKDEKQIFELGDGVQSIILLTYPIFISDSSLFFIEEPETHMHPGMQRKFLELILNGKSEYLKNKRNQYFITTHSNHFIDLALDYNDISIYKFSGKDHTKKNIELVEWADESVLNELGVRNSSVFLTNATIWVEGITDRLYIKKFLELYLDSNPDKKRIFEDVHYSFVEYGGNNITHWSFLDNDDVIYVDRLCSKAFLITDKDGESKQKRIKKLEEKLGEDRYKCLECREIENILSLQTLEKTIKKFPADSNFVLPNNIIGYKYQNKKIGDFIREKLCPNNSYDVRGTIKEKLKFCKKAIEDMEYADMTDLAIRLAERVYNFVIDQNK